MGNKPGRTIDLGELLIDITVDSQLSNEMDFSGWRGGLVGIVIDGPGTLTGTAKFQVSHSKEDTDEYGTTWRDFQSAGSDVTIPADGSVQVNSASFKRIRIASSDAEEANRRFRVYGIESPS